MSAVHCCAALLATLPRLVVPRRRDPRLLAGLDVIDPPEAKQTVRVRALVHDSRAAPRAVVVEGQWRPASVEISMMTFLVEHPAATFLVDPALCANTRSRVLTGMPAPKRRLLGSGADGPGILEVLDRNAVDPAAIDFAVATHLHWDHVSGMLDLPNVELRASAEERVPRPSAAYERDGSIPGLHQAVRPAPFDLDGPPVLTFTRSHDLMDDGSVLAVDLPGHTPGSIGLLLAEGGGRHILLAGDAAWHANQIRSVRQKAPLPGRLADHDRTQTFHTLHRLHALPPSVTALPAHDVQAAQQALGG